MSEAEFRDRIQSIIEAHLLKHAALNGYDVAKVSFEIVDWPLWAAADPSPPPPSPRALIHVKLKDGRSGFTEMDLSASSTTPRSVTALSRAVLWCCENAEDNEDYEESEV